MSDEVIGSAVSNGGDKMICHDIGPLDAKIMIIGEAPGREEEAKGIPFVGPTGKLLKSMCLAIGIDYTKCYITNVSPDRPPNNKFGYFYEDDKREIPKESLRKKWFILGDKIKGMKPSVVICLGEEALRAVTNLRGIGTWRGTRIDAYDTKVIATYHPASILRDFTKKASGKQMLPYKKMLVEMDLRKALRESKGLIYKEPVITMAPTISRVLDWMSYAPHAKRISFDIETIGKMIRCIGFAYKDSNEILNSICIPFMQMVQGSALSMHQIGGSMIGSLKGGDVNYWDQANEEIVLNAIAEILENPSVQKIGQNSITFDAPLIKTSFGIEINNHCMDLMHAWHVLYPSLPKSLDFISSILTDHPNYWTKHDASVDESEWRYNCMDTVVTLEAADKVEDDLRLEGLSDLYFEHVHPLQFDLLKAQERGVVFDVERAHEMKIELEKEVDDIRSQMDALAGEDFNPNSPKQVKHLLFDTLGFPVMYKKHTKKQTTDENALRTLEERYPDEPMLGMIVQYRKMKKLISTYVDVKLDEDGRIRCSYNASGTKTGRISSSKTIWGTGMNLHNIPKGYTRGSRSTRHLYKAAEQNMFVVGDLKQAEAMVVAWILKAIGDPTLYDLYHREGFDIHRWCAAMVYGVDEEAVTKSQRQGGKLANHSGNYMAGPGVMQKKALSDGIKGFNFKTCKEILAKRSRAIPGLKLWWMDVEEKIKATRTLTTCFDRRLHFFGRLDHEELRSAVAFEPQSIVGDVCNQMFRELSCSDVYWPVLTTHDEIVLETPEKTLDVAVEALIGTSKVVLNIRPNVEPLVIPIEIMVGKNWGELEEWKGA